MKFSDIIRPVKAGQDHFAELRGRSAAEQEADIAGEFTKYKRPQVRLDLNAVRYGLPLERIAAIALDHGYRFTQTLFEAKTGVLHRFERIGDPATTKRDAEARAQDAKRQETEAAHQLFGRPFLQMMLIDVNRCTLPTDRLDALAAPRGYRYTRTTEPTNGCSWHIFERTPEP